MTQFGEHLAESAEQALAWARSGNVPGMVAHEPVPAIDVRAVRRRTGLTQAEFARSFGFPLGALRNWEQGIRTPRGAGPGAVASDRRRARGGAAGARQGGLSGSEARRQLASLKVLAWCR